MTLKTLGYRVEPMGRLTVRVLCPPCTDDLAVPESDRTAIIGRSTEKCQLCGDPLDKWAVISEFFGGAIFDPNGNVVYPPSWNQG